MDPRRIPFLDFLTYFSRPYVSFVFENIPYHARLIARPFSITLGPCFFSSVVQQLLALGLNVFVCFFNAFEPHTFSSFGVSSSVFQCLLAPGFSFRFCSLRLFGPHTFVGEAIFFVSLYFSHFRSF